MDSINKHVILAEITGHNRLNYNGRTVIFDTFSTLSDPIDYFAEAMNTELEHGKAGNDVLTNITDDDALATAKIVTAHILGVERSSDSTIHFPDYYDWLWWMEGLHSKAVNRK